MKNHIQRAIALLTTATLAAALVVAGAPVTTYAADDKKVEWSDQDDDDWDSDDDKSQWEELIHDEDDDPDPGHKEVEGKVRVPSDIRMNKGTSVGVDAAVYTSAEHWRLEWSVSGPAVSVSGAYRDTANLYAQKVGTSTVTIRLFDGDGNQMDSGYFSVYVSEPEPTHVKVTGVSVNVSSMTLSPGDTGRIRATVYPLNASNKDVNWSTSDGDVVSVDGDGVVRARKNGDAVIYARSAETGASATCKIHVSSGESKSRVKGIAVDSHDVALMVGASRDVNVRVTPDNARNKGFTGSTSNADVAIVDGKGIIYGINNGSCIITYRTNEANYVSQVKVTVYGGTSNKPLNNKTVTETVNKAKTTPAATTTTTATATLGHDPTTQYGYLQKIAGAAAGSTVILHTSAPSAYDVNVLNAIKARPDVKVVAEFPFQNVEFQLVVPASFDASSLLVGGYVDWLTLCNYQGKGVTVTAIGAAQP